jgi:hypothetical protein
MAYSPSPSPCAVAFYCASFFVNSIAYNRLFESVAHGRRLVRPEIHDMALSRIRKAYRFGLVVYAAAVAVALWNAAAGLVLRTSLWLVWTSLGYVSESRTG